MDVLASTNCSIAKISFDSFAKCIGGPLLEVIERNKVKVFKNIKYIYIIKVIIIRYIEWIEW